MTTSTPADVRRPEPGENQSGHIATGHLGEDLAHGYLHRLGWRIIERNWRCPHGEIDIVAEEVLEDGRRCLVFVEVKCRRGLGYGDPLEAITRQKLARLSLLAGCWLREHEDSSDLVRIDALGVLLGAGPTRFSHARGVTR